MMVRKLSTVTFFKFGKLWFRLKRDEAMMIWRARNGLVHQDEEPFCWATLRSKFRDALLFLREQGKPIPDKEARRTASRHFMEKFVAKTSNSASAELMVAFLVNELKTPLNPAERLLLVQRSQKSAIGARISRARLIRSARQREASKVQSSLTKHWSFPGGPCQAQPVPIRSSSRSKRGTQRVWSTPRTTHSTTELTDNHVGVWSDSSDSDSD